MSDLVTLSIEKGSSTEVALGFEEWVRVQLADGDGTEEFRRWLWRVARKART